MLRSGGLKNLLVTSVGLAAAALIGVYAGRGNLSGGLQLLIFLVGVLVAFLVRPKYLLIAAIILLPLEFIAGWVPVDLPMNLLPADVGLIAYAISAVARRLLRPHPSTRAKTSNLVLAAGVLALLFLIVGLISAFDAGFSTAAVRKLGRTALILMAVWATPAVLRSEDVRLCCKTLFAVGAVAAFYALVEGMLAMLGVNTRIWGSIGPFPRLLGGFADPNYFAYFLALVTPLAMARVLVSRRIRPWPFIGLVLLVAATVGTFSRGGALGLGAGALVVAGVAIFRRQGRGFSSAARSLALVVLFVAVLALLASATPASWGVISDRYAAASDIGQDPTAVLRLRIWRNAIDLLNDSPILGIGPGNFLARMGEASPDTAFYAHNSLLEATVETGVVGGVLLLLIVILLLVASLMAARRPARSPDQEDPDRSWLIGLVGAIVAAAVASSFLSNALFLPSTAIVLILLSTWWTKRESPTVPPPTGETPP